MPPPLQLQVDGEEKLSDSPGNPRKCLKKYLKWKRKQGDELTGLSEEKKYELFGEDKTFLGKLRREKKWFVPFEDLGIARGPDEKAPSDEGSFEDSSSSSPVVDDPIVEVPENSETVNMEESDEPEPIILANGEVIEAGSQPQTTIDAFNTLYNRATSNGAEITADIWSFDDYLNGDSAVGNYVASYIQDLPETPEDYTTPATFALSGVQPTYDAAREYRNPWGNCYSTSASRVNGGYEDLYGETPIDYSQNDNGTFTSGDYRTASSQSGATNFGYGVGGALMNGGEGEGVDNAGVWAGDLHPGAALQIWHSTDPDNIADNGGHSQIFISYIRDEEGEITGLNVYDNSGAIEVLQRANYEGSETIQGANLVDQ
jgi:hypothetical protein